MTTSIKLLTETSSSRDGREWRLHNALGGWGERAKRNIFGGELMPASWQ